MTTQVSTKQPDVLVIGGGNAALCAALMAVEAGASVLMLESAPREWRGGNSGHTRNLRCMHDAPQDVLVEAYPEEEFWQDLLKVTGGLTNEHLARLACADVFLDTWPCNAHTTAGEALWVGVPVVTAFHVVRYAAVLVLTAIWMLML